MTDEAEIRAHNLRESWREIAGHLNSARHSVEQAQGCLEDISNAPWADVLQPIVDDLRRAANEANEIVVEFDAT